MWHVWKWKQRNKVRTRGCSELQSWHGTRWWWCLRRCGRSSPHCMCPAEETPEEDKDWLLKMSSDSSARWAWRAKYLSESSRVSKESNYWYLPLPGVGLSIVTTDDSSVLHERLLGVNEPLNKSRRWSQSITLLETLSSIRNPDCDCDVPKHLPMQDRTVANHNMLEPWGTLASCLFIGVTHWKTCTEYWATSQLSTIAIMWVQWDRMGCAKIYRRRREQMKWHWRFSMFKTFTMF